MFFYLIYSIFLNTKDNSNLTKGMMNFYHDNILPQIKSAIFSSYFSYKKQT